MLTNSTKFPVTEMQEILWHFLQHALLPSPLSFSTPTYFQQLLVAALRTVCSQDVRCEVSTLQQATQLAVKGYVFFV